MKITIILPSLEIGGAEQLTVNLINEWIKKKIEIELILLSNKGSLSKKIINKNILKIKYLNVNRLKNSFLPLINILRKSNPEIIWVNMWPLTSIAILSWMLSGRKGKIFITDHNSLKYQINNYSRYKFLNKLFLGITYRFACGISTVSKDVRDELSKITFISKKKIRVIYNPVAVGKTKLKKLFDSNEKKWNDKFKLRFLSVGNLKKEKNYECLIKAFALLPKSLDAQLTILGDGPLKNQLYSLINKLNLKDEIFMPGQVLNPYSWYKSADLFILSSVSEGFGNVLVEALECGLPIVSTNCFGGPKEILENGKYGKLVEVNNVNDLKNGIIEQLNKKHDKKKLIERSQDFLISKISSDYLSFFRTKK